MENITECKEMMLETNNVDGNNEQIVENVKPLAKFKLTKANFLKTSNGYFLASSYFTRGFESVFKEGIDQMHLRENQWKRILLSGAAWRTCYIFRNYGEYDSWRTQMLSRLSETNVQFANIVPLMNFRLSKTCFMDLLEGLFLISNQLNDQHLPVFYDFIAPKGLRGEQWKRIVLSCADNRMCYVFRSSDECIAWLNEKI